MGVPDPDRDKQFYAGVPVRRLFAFGIDLVITMGLLLVVAFFGIIFSTLTAGFGAPLAILAASMTGFVYRFVMLQQRSATLGMIVTGIEVRDKDGEKADQTTALLHTAGYYATCIFTPLLIIGWFLMATSPHRRTMHDLFIGAVVINRPA